MEHSDLLFSAVGEEYAARKKLGLLLVSSSFVVLHATDRANELLASGRMGIQDGVLRCLDTEDQQTLDQIFQNLTAADSSDSDGAGTDMLAGRQTGFPILLSIVPAPARSVGQAQSDGRFAVILRCPRHAEEADVDRLMHIFRLTEREAQLALHLATGGRLAEFAQERHLAMNTVKTHLKQVFKKVGANSQLRVAIMMISALT